MTTRLANHLRAAMLLMLAAGFACLAGCLPIPATRQCQLNGKPRPESLLDQRGSPAIVVGQTGLVEAISLLRERVMPWCASNPLFATVPMNNPDFFAWSMTPDGRRAVVYFQLKTATLVWPFFINSDSEARAIVLDVNDAQRISGWRSVDPSSKRQFDASRFLDAQQTPETAFAGLPQSVREALVERGLLRDANGERHPLPGTRPTTMGVAH